jgi:hypothetical protein
LCHDVTSTLRALEHDSHIVSKAERIDFRDALTDLICIDTTEERIPEAVSVTPFVIAVAVARIGVKNAHTRLTLRNTVDGSPPAVGVAVAVVGVDPSVRTVSTSALVGLTRIVVPLANVGEVTALVRIVVEQAVVELTRVVVGEPAATNFETARRLITIETTTRLDVSETVFVVRRPVAPVTEGAVETLSRSRVDHIIPSTIATHLQFVTTGILVGRNVVSTRRSDLSVGVLLLPGGVNVGSGDLASGRLSSGVTRTEVAPVPATDLASGDGGDGSVRAVERVTVLAETGLQEHFPGRRNRSDVGEHVLVPGGEKPDGIVASRDTRSPATETVEGETFATIVTFPRTTNPAPEVVAGDIIVSTREPLDLRAA